ncbi:MAG: PHP domain-containing protein [Anaerolineae bacterium]|nr:PHP domain-containing protein [Anaerolineae bacterium]MDW8101337.1 PHP domain-containing protein [Anaerolineae bacterium]
MKWKIDLHLHTYYSKDGLCSPARVVELSQARGLAKIAITDHNSIVGALEAKKIAPEFVIVGEEVKTKKGELLALFIEEEIPPGLDPLETIRRIREQGGIVGIPHPFDRLRREAMGHYALEIIGEVDFLEGFNARTIFTADDAKAFQVALERGIPVSGGSDAHTPWEIGMAWVEVEPFRGEKELLEVLRKGRITGRRSPLWVHIFSTLAKFRQ